MDIGWLTMNLYEWFSSFLDAHKFIKKSKRIHFFISHDYPKCIIYKRLSILFRIKFMSFWYDICINCTDQLIAPHVHLNAIELHDIFVSLPPFRVYLYIFAILFVHPTAKALSNSYSKSFATLVHPVRWVLHHVYPCSHQHFSSFSFQGWLGSLVFLFTSPLFSTWFMGLCS